MSCYQYSVAVGSNFLEDLTIDWEQGTILIVKNAIIQVRHYCLCNSTPSYNNHCY